MTSVRYRGELSVGYWTLEVRDVSPTRYGIMGTSTLSLRESGDRLLRPPPAATPTVCSELRSSFQGLPCCSG